MEASVITRSALERSARQLGTGYVFEGASPLPDEPVLVGRFNTRCLRPGLILHAAEVRDLHDMRTSHTLNHPGIKIGLVIGGATDITFGHRRFRIGPESPDIAGRTQALLLNLTEPTVFSRRWQRNRTERKVTLTLTNEWLGEFSGNDGTDQFTRGHLNCQPWTPSVRALELAQQILAPDAYLAGMHRLRLESRCIELAAEALATLSPCPPPCDGLSVADRRRLVRLEELLNDETCTNLSMEEIARAVGSNPSTLQTLARRIWGTTVFDRLRAIRMKKAHSLLAKGVSVGEAAEVAGYSSPANFATAFRLRYGINPRQVRSAEPFRHEL